MTKLAVIEPQSSALRRDILRKLATFLIFDVTVIGAVSPELLIGSNLDVVVVSPRFEERSVVTPEKVKCGIALVPGGFSAGYIDAKSIVTYGMNSRDSITLSSIGEKNCVLALQRELVTAGGKILDRQELLVRREMSPGQLLASAGAVLLVDGALS